MSVSKNVVDLASLSISDAPAVWEQLGFTVSEDTVRVGVTTVHLGAPGTGITGWALSGIAVGADIDGIKNGEAGPPATPALHANGVESIDHLVVMTPDVERTAAALEALGLACRRRREGEAYGKPMQQAFFWLGAGGETGTILEVVGPPEADPDTQSTPARFFGICFTVADLDATGAFFGAHMKPPTEAVQPGRRITTISSKAGSSVAIALMSPHVKP